MTLAAGARLGSYEIVSAIGAGGMGEVYRARDSRLAREVAIKVLPAELAANPERLKRFEKEARSASALNHPNIVTVYDAGVSDGVSWIAMERVDGDNLRKLLAGGAIPLRKLLAWSTQIADGLAKAHAMGIVHRDLKPENLMVTREGVVKILDFGLAKLVEPVSGSGDVELTQSPTASLGTEAGIVVGTVGYMSPEQAMAKPLDFRSDQFSFGSVLYEMATGNRAFSRASTPETMTAIIRDEPETLATASPSTPLPLRWIVERCLAKDPEERYASTKDLSRDLARLRDGLSEGTFSGAAIAMPTPRSRTWSRIALEAAILLAGVAIGVIAMRKPRESPPLYRPVTFQRGAIGVARFAPDGKTIFYSASWQGKPPQIFSTRLDSTESSAVPLPGATLQSISNSGKLAVLVGHGDDPAAIAEASLAGGAPRELVAADPRRALQFEQGSADWSPADDRLAVIRNGQLEFPVGKVLVPASGGRQVAGLRFSPDGRRIAFSESESRKSWAVGVVDLAGRKTILSSGWDIITSVAWNPVTGEIWFSARQGAARIGVVELHAVSLSGVERAVARTPQLLIVQDIARDGRVLARSDDWPETMICRPPGASREVNLTWLDFSRSAALSEDGKDVLFLESGAGAGATGGVYLRKTDGATAAIRLGDGRFDSDLSRDKKWVVQAFPDRVVVLPVGPGESRTIQDEGFQYRRAVWLPDGNRILFWGRTAGHPSRMYLRDLSGGPPRPITPDGVGEGELSPDGRLVATVDEQSGNWVLYPVDGGKPRPLPSHASDDNIVGFDDKSENLYVASGTPSARIDRLELATGKRTPFLEISLADPTGVSSLASLQLTPDGRAYCYSFLRSLSRLYVIEGLR